MNLREIEDARRQLADTAEMVEATAIDFGATLQRFKRLLGEILTDDDQLLSEIQNACDSMLSLPSITISFSRDIKSHFKEMQDIINTIPED